MPDELDHPDSLRQRTMYLAMNQLFVGMGQMWRDTEKDKPSWQLAHIDLDIFTVCHMYMAKESQSHWINKSLSSPMACVLSQQQQTAGPVTQMFFLSGILCGWQPYPVAAMWLYPFESKMAFPWTKWPHDPFITSTMCHLHIPKVLRWGTFLIYYMTPMVVNENIPATPMPWVGSASVDRTLASKAY